MFKASDSQLQSTATDGQSPVDVNQLAEESISYNKLACIGTGILAALSFSLEVVLVKELTIFNVEGVLSGMFYTMFVGILGAVGLIIYTIIGGMADETFTLHDYIVFTIGGIFECLGQISETYAASIGIGGIAFGLANTCCIYVTIFNYLAMS